MESFDDILEMFRNGDLDVELYFNDYETFFNILKRKGAMYEIDPRDVTDGPQWENEYLLWLHDTDREKFYKYIQSDLADVVFENGKVFWQDERKDLARLFCDNRRNDLSRDTIETILSGEDFYEQSWDTTDDVYRDVVEELNEENIKILKNSIVKYLKGQKLSPETEEMELIATEQGHDEYWEITDDNVSRILDDEKSMKSLLNDELSDLKSELYSIHQQAYNSAYESEIYKRIYKELEDYFDMSEGRWISTKHPYKKETTIEKYKVPIWNFDDIITEFLQRNKGYGSSGNISNYGNYIELIREDHDCLSAYPPEYPDSREVDKLINDFFGDYIY